VEVVIYDWPSTQADATLSNNTLQLKTSYDAARHAIHILMPDIAKETELRVRTH
jgi:hypothetical protein